MKKYFIFILLILTGICLFAQYDSLWDQVYGGSLLDVCNSVIETSDSSYLFVGYTDSYGAGSGDFWIIKTNQSGDTLWAKTYGGTDYDICNAAIETSDSCYLLVGNTESYGAGGGDIWVVKTDADGDTLWAKTYGGGSYDDCFSVIETKDGSYLIAGCTASYGAGNVDYWVIKTDAEGDTLWTHTYGGSLNEYCNAIIETQDSSYLLAGYTNSYGAGQSDYWLIKTNQNGDTLWTKLYGGSAGDYCTSAIETKDSSYLLAGRTYSYGVAGTADYWIIKTNQSGDTLWTKTYGGSGIDWCTSVIETKDSSYFFTGRSDSYTPGNDNSWSIKTDQKGDILWTKIFGGSGSECSNKVIETKDSSYLLAGQTYSYGAGFFDYYLIKIVNLVPGNFTLIPYTKYVSTSDVLLSWNHSHSLTSSRYEIYFNSFADTAVPFTDTTYSFGGLNEGQYIWHVTAVSAYGYKTDSYNIDTFYVDKTPPVMIAIEEIKDTAYSGPFKLRIMAEDTMAGIDSIAINYMLPEDSLWSRMLTTEKSGLWYTGYIPSVTQTGYVYYYLEIYDRSVPANKVRYPSYPDVYSFEVTSLSGLDEQNKSDTYALNIKPVGEGEIELQLPTDSPVTIQVYDVSGRSVIKQSMNMSKGRNKVHLDLNSGVYFVKVNSKYGEAENKIVKIK